MSVQYGIDADGLASIAPGELAAFQGGKQFAVGYLGTDDQADYLRPAEAAALIANGVSVVSVYQTQGMSDTGPDGNYSNAWVRYIVPGQGTADAAAAIAGAKAAGQTNGAIYFAMDLDPGSADLSGLSEADALAHIDEYFQEIRAYFTKVGAKYDIGIYGAGDTLTKIAGDPATGVRLTWLADASGWAGNATYTGETIQQYQNNAFSIDAIPVDLDRTSGSAYGQWNASFPFAVSDSAAHVARSLDGLESLAAQGKLGSIALTDSGIPTLSISAAQTVSDATALQAISGSYVLSVAVPATGATVEGVRGQGATAVFSGAASQYTVTPAGDGVNFTVSASGGTAHLSNITALQFSDLTDIVASQTPPAGGAVSSAMVTELYSAVLGRVPDVPGLAYYEASAAASPTLPFIQFAEWFLASPEYTGNAAHAYALNSSGDAQFITDCYNNLLGRGPASGDVAWYQSHIIAPILSGLVSGTAAYAAAATQSHAQVLASFSQSPEFLADVTVTAQHPSSAQHWLVLV